MNTKQVVILVITVAVASLTALGIFIYTHQLEAIKLYESVVLDNERHHLSCDQLPTIEEVDRVVREHKDVVDQIVKEVGKHYRDDDFTPVWNSEQGMVSDGADRGYVMFTWGETMDCLNTNRGDIHIFYLSHKDRVIIKRLIGGDTFFGIPYRLTNS